MPLLGRFSLYAALALAHAHSWVEEVRHICEDRTFCGDAGYPRGYVPRTSEYFLTEGDITMTYLLPPNGRINGAILPSDHICMPSQRLFNETLSSPSLRARPSDRIALRYQENGHITLPTAKIGKLTPGSAFIYGTSHSHPNDTLLGIHHKWSTDGSGGDKRGRLLANSPFDDGHCYQVNNSTESRRRQTLPQPPHDTEEGINLWCENEVTLPHDLVAGSIFTLYWVWDWPTAANPSLYEAGKEEIYTTCIDIIVE
ncbi:MAG: hypothetical protein M1821_007777 [Bathelium mastoideum]|nr:MAG: hypothetical protein M1821_007777 [Bathelium mastoideum]